MIGWLARSAVALALAALFASGCSSGDGDSSPTVTATAAPTEQVSATASATPAMTPSPSPSATATTEVTPEPVPPRTVWLIDATTGAVLTLYQDDEFVDARFDAAGTTVQLGTADGPSAFDLDGSPVPPVEQPQCLQDDADAVVDGVTFEETRCGLISPNGRWMLFEVPIAGANGDWDQWVLDLGTGERRLLEAGLRHCGGCDGRFGPAFSPGGDHVYFPELIQEGRLYVADLRAGEVEMIGEGSTEFVRKPVWAPTGTRLLYTDDGERVLVRDFEGGGPSEVLALDWSAGFDATGTAIYSPVYSHPGEDVSTTVVDATTFETLVTVDGAAGPAAVWYPRVVAARSADGVVLSVEQAATCEDGTTIYTPESAEGVCFDAAVGAVVSADARYVAFAVTPDDAPSFRRPSDYSIVIVDTETLEPIATIEGAQSYDAPPVLEWNATSTHLLATWPWALGL